LVPKDPNPYDSYAELLLKMGRFDNSIENYNKALKLDPHFTPSIIGIATNLNLLNKHADARTLLNELLANAQNNEDHRQALYAISVSYVDEGNIPSGIKTLKSLLNSDRKNEDAFSMARDIGTIGDCFYELMKYDSAMYYYNQVPKIILDSNLPDEIKELGRNYHKYQIAKIALTRGDLTTAKKNAQDYEARATELGNQPQIWAYHRLNGMIAMKEKEYDQALAEYNRANQQNPYIIYQIAMAYRDKGDMLLAKKYLTRAAHFNIVNSMEYAFIRKKAENMLQKYFNG